MDNKNIILIDEQEKEEARALTQSFARSDIKSRAYINALGAEVLLKYFEQQNITKEQTYNLHNIRKILEEFDISDIKLSNIHIDVRVVFDENQIFIPKTHFEYNLLPDIYVVLKLAKDHSSTEFLGFFEPKLINKNNANDKYYFIEKEKLSSPVDLKNYIENFKSDKSENYSEDDISQAELLMISMADHNVSEEDKKTLLNYLVNSAALRDEFIEFENFEMISYQAANVVGLELPVNNNSIDIAAEDVPSDIADDMLTSAKTDLLTEADIVEEPLDNSSNAGEIIKGAAVLGAEIAGTAMASAALAGAEEAVDTTTNIVNAAANVANNVSEAIDMASSIQNMAEQVFSDESVKMPEVPDGLNLENMSLENIDVSLDENLADIGQTEEQPSVSETASETEDSAISEENSLNDFINTNEAPQDEKSPETLETSAEGEISLDDFINVNETPEEQSIETTDSSGSEDISLDDFISANESSDDNNPDDMNGSINDLFSDYDTETGQKILNNEEPVFSNSDDLIFNDSTDSEEITFSNNDDYGDELIFETPDDGYGDMADGGVSSRRQRNPLASGLHTPISEATELTSLEDIKNGNIPKAVTPPLPSEDQMETMGMEEFHNLVKNYVPPEIKDESETISFDNVGGSSAIKMSASEEDSSKFKDLSEFTSLPDKVEKPQVNTVTESDPYVEELPVAEVNTEVKITSEEPTSDDFVTDMPEATNTASATQHADELSSDDFVADMPEATNTASATQHADELSSDDFVADMPEATNTASATQHADELSSDDFVADMPEATNTASATQHAEELTSDDFVAEMPAEVNTASATQHADELTSDDFIEDVPGITKDFDSGNITSLETPPSLDGSILDELDSIALGELEEPLETGTAEDLASSGAADFAEQNENTIQNETADIKQGMPAAVDENSNIEICEEPAQASTDSAAEDESKLQVLYDKSQVPELESLEDSLDMGSDDEMQPESEENFDFRPERKMGKLMPVFAILAAIVIAGSVVGFLMKSKNSIDAETLIQTTPENEAIANPEADNSDILANTGELDTPNIPSDASDISPAAPAIPQNVKEDKPAAKTAEPKPAAAKPVQKPQVTKPAAPKPINSSKTITLKKLSWQVPDYLSYSQNINEYLQTAGKSIKLTLSSDLLLTNEYIYSNQVKVNINLTKDGNVTSTKIVKSSGSEQVDKIVLQTVKDTLNVVKPARGEVPTPNYNLALIIYL